MFIGLFYLRHNHQFTSLVPTRGRKALAIFLIFTSVNRSTFDMIPSRSSTATSPARLGDSLIDAQPHD